MSVGSRGNSLLGETGIVVEVDNDDDNDDDKDDNEDDNDDGGDDGGDVEVNNAGGVVGDVGDAGTGVGADE